jgi:hypothetical protein
MSCRFADLSLCEPANPPAPIFSVFCIDYRFDAMVARFYEETGKQYNYFACTVAGGALALGYEKYQADRHACCKRCGCCKANGAINSINSINSINAKYPKPLDQIDSVTREIDQSMRLLRDNLVENLKISLGLKPVTDTYLMNHQDCGAIKAVLKNSGYPKQLGDDNNREIKINTDLLIYARHYMARQFPAMRFTMGFVDINGSVATLDIASRRWTVIYVGEYNDPLGTWHGMGHGDALII